MQFKEEYWIIENISKDLVYAPKFSIYIYNIMWNSQFEYILRGNIEL